MKKKIQIITQYVYLFTYYNKIIQVYVGNLNCLIDEDELTNFFKKHYLSILSSKIIRDSTNGKSKGFGFVNLSDYHEYTKILKFNKNIIFHGQVLTIK